MAHMQLTKEEADLIVTKREEERKKAEEEARLEEERGTKAIAAMEDQIRKSKEQERLHANAVATFFSQFVEKAGGGLYKLVRTPEKKTFTADNGRWGENKKVYQTKEVDTESRHIEYTRVPGYKVIVKEHTSYRRRGFHSMNHGLKMFVSFPNNHSYGTTWYKIENRAFTNARKVHDHITAHIAEAEQKAETQKKSTDAYEQAIAALKANYPQANVVKETDGHYSRYYDGRWNRREQFVSHQVVQVTFPNGLQLNYTAQLDGEGKLQLDRKLKAWGKVDLNAIIDQAIAAPAKAEEE